MTTNTDALTVKDEIEVSRLAVMLAMQGMPALAASAGFKPGMNLQGLPKAARKIIEAAMMLKHAHDALTEAADAE